MLSFSNYDVVDFNSVTDFIEDNSYYLSEFIESAHTEIAKYFPNSPIRLQLISDPEIDNWRKLWFKVILLSSDDFDNALTQLKLLDDNWWLNLPVGIRLLMNIDLEIE